MGGVLGPVFVYLLLNDSHWLSGIYQRLGNPHRNGHYHCWLAAKLVFTTAIRHQLFIAFIVDDALGLIIAIFYPTSTVMPIYLLFCLAGMVVAFLLRRFGVKSYWWYILLGRNSLLVWAAFCKCSCCIGFGFHYSLLPVAPEDVTDIDDTDDERAFGKI